MADSRISQRGLARTLGMDASALSLTFHGKRTMKITEAVSIARLLGVPADEVMKAAGVRVESGGERIPFVGYIDPEGEAHWEPMGETLHPGAGLPDNIAAIQCRTGTGALEHMDGWVLYKRDINPGEKPEIGRLSICRLQSGVMYLGTPKRSFMRGKHDVVTPTGFAGLRLDQQNRHMPVDIDGLDHKPLAFFASPCMMCLSQRLKGTQDVAV